jgi:hypothetical protein
MKARTKQGPDESTLHEISSFYPLFRHNLAPLKQKKFGWKGRDLRDLTEN